MKVPPGNQGLAEKGGRCRAIGIGMGGSVKLQVKTRRANQEIGNWQVLYLLKIFENAPGVTPGLFPRWSSPTEESLEPGRYWMWARDPVSKQTSERVLVR